MNALSMNTGGEMVLTGLSLIWGVPFMGLLLSIALGPLLWAHQWHHHFGKVSLFWSSLILGALMWQYGPIPGFITIADVLLHHYVPFVVMVGSLYIMARGLRIQVTYTSTPLHNTVFLAVAALCSSIMGTTGAAMVFIRPFLRMNHDRLARQHLVIFFIFLVCNIGGSLTAVGDPPLFLGFLKGVPFFWPAKGLGPLFLVVVSYLLIGFFILDRYHWRREGHHGGQPHPQLHQQRPHHPHHPPSKGTVHVTGWFHGFLMMAALGSVVILGGQKDWGSIHMMGIHVAKADILRDGFLILCSGLSFLKQRHFMKTDKEDEAFWAPIVEIALLFLAIFITAHPVLTMLHEGKDGPLGFLTHMVTNEQGLPIPSLYFWVSGVLSSFLDNAPTYLVFFELAGGDVHTLLTTSVPILTAFSAGSVFMGAMTYIGNAPNFMVKSISGSKGIKMPHFFEYMGWSILWLLPIFLFVSLLFF